jgi:hypothetical protein
MQALGGTRQQEFRSVFLNVHPFPLHGRTMVPVIITQCYANKCVLLPISVKTLIELASYSVPDRLLLLTKPTPMMEPDVVLLYVQIQLMPTIFQEYASSIQSIAVKFVDMAGLTALPFDGQIPTTPAALFSVLPLLGIPTETILPIVVLQIAQLPPGPTIILALASVWQFVREYTRVWESWLDPTIVMVIIILKDACLPVSNPVLLQIGKRTYVRFVALETMLAGYRPMRTYSPFVVWWPFPVLLPPINISGRMLLEIASRLVCLTPHTKATLIISAELAYLFAIILPMAQHLPCSMEIHRPCGRLVSLLAPNPLFNLAPTILTSVFLNASINNMAIRQATELVSRSVRILEESHGFRRSLKGYACWCVRMGLMETSTISSGRTAKRWALIAT